MNEKYLQWIRNIWIIRPEDQIHFTMCPWFWLHKNILNLLSSETLLYLEWRWFQTVWNIKKKNISASDCLIIRYDTLKKSIEELRD